MTVSSQDYSNIAQDVYSGLPDKIVELNGWSKQTSLLTSFLNSNPEFNNDMSMAYYTKGSHVGLACGSYRHAGRKRDGAVREHGLNFRRPNRIDSCIRRPPNASRTRSSAYPRAVLRP